MKEWVALARAAVLVTRIEVGLRTTSIAALGDRFGVRFDQSASARRSPTRTGTPRLSDEERRRLRAISRVLRYWPFGDTCLRQCLASGSVLREHRPRLVIGVARDDSELSAHSWLELVDGTIDPLAPPAYAALTRVATPAPQSRRRP